jgi:hypothetical protein
MPFNRPGEYPPDKTQVEYEGCRYNFCGKKPTADEMKPSLKEHGWRNDKDRGWFCPEHAEHAVEA